MKTAALALGLAVLLCAGTASAEIVINGAEGRGLQVRRITVQPNSGLDIWTDGCLNPTGLNPDGKRPDSVLYLLESSTPGQDTGQMITQGWSDDAMGGDVEFYRQLGRCSEIQFRNPTTKVRNLVLLISSFSPGTTGFVTLMTSPIMLGAATTMETIFVGGARNGNAPWSGGSSAFLDGTNPDVLLSKPQRGTGFGGEMGRGIEDTIIAAVNIRTGQPSYFDDDAGVRRYSQVTLAGSCTDTTGQCQIIAGGFFPDTAGQVTVFRSRGAYTGIFAGTTQDKDGDGISTDIESSFGTKGDAGDSDNDGFSDFEELIGVRDPAGLTGSDGSLIMPHKDAFPGEPDLFILADFMVASAADTHRPNATLAADIVSIYKDAETFGQRLIHPHVELGTQLTHRGSVGFGACSNPMVTDPVDFYALKKSNFTAMHKGRYHYLVAAHAYYGFDSSGNCTPPSGSTGIAEILGDDVIITLGNDEGIARQRGTYMHEVGHNLALGHNANADDSDNVFKGNYGCAHSSVMNYRWQLSGWSGTTNVMRSFGYSSGACLSTTAGGTTPSGLAQSSNGICGAGNLRSTCTSACIPKGQDTPKGACGKKDSSGKFIASTISPRNVNDGAGNPTLFVSDGTCDCDLAEWKDKVNLRFQGSGNASDGARPLTAFASGISGSTEQPEWLEPYIMGETNRFGARHWEFLQKKRDYLKTLGLKEGRDFQYHPGTGKLYTP